MSEAIVSQDQITEITEGPDAGKFKITGLPDAPANTGGSVGTGTFGSAPPVNADGTVGSPFATEDEAFEAAKQYTAIANVSYCSADGKDGRFVVVRDNQIGFNKRRCQPAVFAEGAEAERDRLNREQLERDLPPGSGRGR